MSELICINVLIWVKDFKKGDKSLVKQWKTKWNKLYKETVSNSIFLVTDPVSVEVLFCSSQPKGKACAESKENTVITLCNLTVGGLHGQLLKYLGAVGHILKHLDRSPLYSDLNQKVVWLSTRRFVPAPPGSGKKTSFLLCIPNWNKAVVILTLLPVQRLFNGSWSHHLGKQHRGKTKQVTPLAMPSLQVPHSFYKLREANHNFMLWFVKSHSSTGGTKKTFKAINFMGVQDNSPSIPFLLFHVSLFSCFTPLSNWMATPLLCKWGRKL